MTSTLTPEQHQAIIDRLTAHPTLARGVGTKETACSIASINLALTGRLTDDIPGCMSEVVGQWIVTIQDMMPDAIRNSSEWRELLPAAAGTGRELERERLAVLLDHMWTVSLPLVQPLADKHGFGVKWRTMCRKRTAKAAAYRAAAAAAHTVGGASAWQTIDPVGLLRQLIEVTA